jgi:hypothetical protein
MRQALKPVDHDRAEADTVRTSIVAKAQRSTAALRKALTKRTDLPVPRVRSRLGDLAITHTTRGDRTSRRERSVRANKPCSL